MKDVKFVKRGMAAMPFFSLINHSCNSNTLKLSTASNHIVMYAIYPIRKGEQVLNCLYKLKYSQSEI